MSPGLELPPPNCPRGAEGLGQPAPGQGQLGDSSGTAQGRATEAAARGDPARHSGEPSARWLPAGQVASKISKTSTFAQPKGSEQRERERYGAGRNRGAPGFPNHQRANGGDWCQPHRCRGACRELSGGRRWDGEDFCSTWELTHLPAMGSGWARCLWSSLGAPKSPCSIPMQYPLRP